MANSKEKHKFDLEERTFKFARACANHTRSFKKDFAALEQARQLVRSSGSVAANYIEANESLSKKDFRMRIKICRKEAKESMLWLKLLDQSPEGQPQNNLLREAGELVKIFSSIAKKFE
ncbi:MAG: four helix bundle protein [Candidatus Paceibacterota bacterium]